MQFTDLGLSASLLQTITEQGYITPTPIQQASIPQILRGRDLFACAQTGTGKTASFVLPMIDFLTEGRAKNGLPRAIILEPTRELAAQVLDNFTSYNKAHVLKAVLLVGGESMPEQERALKRGADILIATPGRLLDLFDRGRLILNNIKFWVIDEADRMLDMGFTPDIDRIHAILPRLRQTVLFSATLPPEIKKLAQAYLTNPKEILVTPSAQTSKNVTHYVVKTPPEHKTKRLIVRQILKSQGELKSVIIFCNRKNDVDILTKSLKVHGFKANCLHGDLSQSLRNETLEDFKNGHFAILVASNVAARGLDVDGLNLVINFEVPNNPEDYVHRIGRTGRAGNTGTAFTLQHPKESKLLKTIETLIKQPIPEFSINSEELQEEETPKKRETIDHSPREKTQRRKRDSFTREHRHPEAQPSTPVVGFGELTPAFMLLDPFAKTPI